MSSARGITLVIAALTAAAVAAIDSACQAPPATLPGRNVTTEGSSPGRHRRPSARPSRVQPAPSIWPGANIQNVVDAYPGATTFCLRAGAHSLTSSIRPKTGNTFVGEYGAILDGSGWSTSDDTQGAFRAHNEDIDYVTIRNLVIRNMPQQGIHTYYWMSDHWTIEYNEIAYAKIGLEFAPNFTIRNNYIHHNVGISLVVESRRARWRLPRGSGR